MFTRSCCCTSPVLVQLRFLYFSLRTPSWCKPCKPSTSTASSISACFLVLHVNSATSNHNNNNDVNAGFSTFNLNSTGSNAAMLLILLNWTKDSKFCSCNAVTSKASPQKHIRRFPFVKLLGFPTSIKFSSMKGLVSLENSGPRTLRGGKTTPKKKGKITSLLGYSCQILSKVRCGRSDIAPATRNSMIENVAANSKTSHPDQKPSQTIAGTSGLRRSAIFRRFRHMRDGSRDHMCNKQWFLCRGCLVLVASYNWTLYMFILCNIS